MKTALLAYLLLPLLALSLPGFAGEAPLQPPYSWRGINGSGVFPAQGIVTEFHDLAADVVTTVKDPKKGEIKLTLPGAPGSRKNIVWRTTLPHWGQNTPVAVKDRVFVLCEEGWKSDAPLLVCLDVKDGKILWQQPVDHLDAWPADKAKVAKETRAKQLRYWREYMTWWNKLYWDNQKNTWKEGVDSKDKSAEVISPEQTALTVEAAKAGFQMPPTWRKGVSGGARGRYYWKVGTEEMKQTYEACAKNRYHWYPGWSSEGPYFGSCMGSVVSDGSRIYAVTALDGAACFDLDGKRLWVADLEGKQMIAYPASADRNHNHMASPVLAGGKLMYYHKDAAEFIALDAQTGRLAWRTPGPQEPWPGGKRVFHQTEGRPIGYDGGHMTPGGTPLVMVLGTTPVVVSGHGMVCRIADGKFLGQVGFPAGLATKGGGAEDEGDTPGPVPAAGLLHASSYTSWVAQGDTLYAVALGRLIAVRLGLKGDALTQEVAWNLAGVDVRNPNPAVLGQAVYMFQGGKGASGVKALDTATGKILASGPGVAGYATNLAFTRDLAVWKVGDGSGGAQDNRFQGTPATFLGRGLVTYTVVGLPDLKPKGNGYLWAENPTGEIVERHIAALGWPRLAASNSGVACWGNRIFIRDNDYLWCVGDPAVPFVPAAPRAADSSDGQRSRDPAPRIAAAQSLMAVPTPPVETVPALIAALGDDYHVVRYASAEALGRIGAPAAPALARALGAADFYTRWGAARALRVAGPSAEAALPALQTALGDGAFDVRMEATHALARLRPSEAKGRALARACEDDSYLVQRAAMEALAQDRVSAAVAVPTLLAAVGHGDDQMQRLTASALAGVGEAAVPEIARRLASGDSAQVRTGAKALGLVGREAAAAAGTAAVPALIRMLTGDDSVTAARALAAIGPAAAAATPDLLKAMLRDVESTRRQVARLLDGYVKDRDTRGAIERSVATRALGAMGAAAVKPLLELLRGDDALTRRFAMEALGRVGPSAEPAVPEMVAYLRAETDPTYRNALMFNIAGVGDGAGAAVPVLAGYLGGTGADDACGRSAAQALAQIGAKTVPALIAALRHPDALVRQRAASALGSMAPNVAGAAREALQAAARDADPAVAAAARQALVHLGGDTSRPAPQEKAAEP